MTSTAERDLLGKPALAFFGFTHCPEGPDRERSSRWPATASTTPHLAAAGFGIAVGTGTDVAMESAGVTLSAGITVTKMQKGK